MNEELKHNVMIYLELITRTTKTSETGAAEANTTITTTFRTI